MGTLAWLLGFAWGACGVIAVLMDGRLYLWRLWVPLGPIAFFLSRSLNVGAGSLDDSLIADTPRTPTKISATSEPVSPPAPQRPAETTWVPYPIEAAASERPIASSGQRATTDKPPSFLRELADVSVNSPGDSTAREVSYFGLAASLAALVVSILALIASYAATGRGSTSEQDAVIAQLKADADSLRQELQQHRQDAETIRGVKAMVDFLALSNRQDVDRFRQELRQHGESLERLRDGFKALVDAGALSGRQKGVVLDPAEKGFHRIDTTNWFFLVSCQDVTLHIGNPFGTTFIGFRIAVSWGYRMPRNIKDAAGLRQWQASLRRQEFTFRDTLLPSQWNKIEFTLPRTESAAAGCLQLILDTDVVSLTPVASATP
jgi:hypothetical protein